MAHAQKIVGVTLVDEFVALTRAGNMDSVTREVTAPAGATIVAIADELGTDVTLRLSAGTRRVEVENFQNGEGVEIATFDSADGRITLQLTGPASYAQPGKIRLRVEAFTKLELQKIAVATRVDAYRNWRLATSGMNRDAVTTVGNPSILRAISAFEGPDSGDAYLAAMAHAVRARMYYEFEVDWHEAQSEANRAAAAFVARGLDDRLNSARARRIEGASLQEIAHGGDETPESKRAAESGALRIYAELTSPGSPLDAVGRARVYIDVGMMAIETQAWSNARANFDKAAALFRSVKHQAGELQVARSLVYLSVQRGDYASASRAYEDVVRKRALIVSNDARATLLINAATAEINVGNTDRAIGYLLEARTIAEEHSLGVPRRRALLTLGLAYWARGDVQQAESFFAAITPLEAKEPADEGLKFNSLRLRGTMLRDAGDPKTALTLHRDALTVARQRPLLRLRAELEIARDHVAADNRADALAAVDAAMEDARTLPTHPVKVEAELMLSEVLVMGTAPTRQALDRAATISNSVVRRAEVDQNLPYEIGARRVLAKVAAARQQNAEAIRELQRAVDLALKYSRTSANPELQASMRAAQQLLFRDYLDLQMSNPSQPESNTLALRAIETIRALNFAATRIDPEKPEVAELDSLLNQLASRHVRIAELGVGEAPDAGRIAVLQLEMATLRAQIDRARSTAATGQPISSDLAAMKAPWRSISPGQIQLSYAFGVARAYVWRRGADGVRAWVLPAGPHRIREAIVEAARIDRLQKPAAYDAAVVKLSALLLPADIVNRNTASVEIVADGELSLVPFGALSSPTDPTQRFAQTHVISMIPSLLQAAPPVTGQHRRWQLVAVRGSDGSNGVAANNLRGSPLFPPLPNARNEIEAVRGRLGAGPQRVRILEDSQASVEQVRDAFAAGVDVMHFATHGLANLRHPLASLLSLPGGTLTAGQIQEWNGDAGLVFLSACETAVGPTRFAEGMPGLQRSFLRAGADNVVATLWPVEDRLAMEFAQQFYGELVRGVSPAEALARTQRSWISSSRSESEQKKTRRRVAAWGYVLFSR